MFALTRPHIFMRRVRNYRGENSVYVIIINWKHNTEIWTEAYSSVYFYIVRKDVASVRLKKPSVRQIRASTRQEHLPRISRRIFNAREHIRRRQSIVTYWRKYGSENVIRKLTDKFPVFNHFKWCFARKYVYALICVCIFLVGLNFHNHSNISLNFWNK